MTKTLKRITVLAQCGDDKVRQVLLTPETEKLLLAVIVANEGKVRILETVLEGLAIEATE